MSETYSYSLNKASKQTFWKRYVCSVSANPGWVSFQIYMFGYFALAVSYILIIMISDSRGFHLVWQNKVSMAVHLVTAVIALSHYILVTRARRKHITMPDLSSKMRNTALFQVALFEEGIIILDKPIWGKGVRFAVMKPAGLTEKNLEIGTQLVFRDEGSALEVPIKLKFYLGKPFDAAEVFFKLLKWDKICNSLFEDTKVLSLEDYIVRVFHDFNEANRDKMGELARAYRTGEMSDPNFSVSLLEVLDFPRKLFSNVDYTAIQVDTVLQKTLSAQET